MVPAPVSASTARLSNATELLPPSFIKQFSCPWGMGIGPLDRRRLLAALTAATAGLAGCPEGESGGEEPESGGERPAERRTGQPHERTTDEQSRPVDRRQRETDRGRGRGQDPAFPWRPLGTIEARERTRVRRLGRLSVPGRARRICRRSVVSHRRPPRTERTGRRPSSGSAAGTRRQPTGADRRCSGQRSSHRCCRRG